MLGSKPRNRFPATVLAPVVDKDDFVIFAEVMKNGLQAWNQLGKRTASIKYRDNYRDVHAVYAFIKQAVTGTLLTVKTELSLKGLDAKKREILRRRTC